MKRFVQIVDRMNHVVGRATMYLIFVMIGVLFYSSVSKTFFFPALWTLEFAQFLMVAYFLLGGAYSIQLRGHVRMDLLYGSLDPSEGLYWAYEDSGDSIFAGDMGTPIVPEPSSMALFAAGAAGLSAFRKRKK